MTPATSSYHQRVQQQKRAAILDAATELFLADGYDGASLAKVARAAGVSTATLFKRFPTKADLFDAIVTEHWAQEGQEARMPAAGDPRAGLDGRSAATTSRCSPAPRWSRCSGS